MIERGIAGQVQISGRERQLAAHHPILTTMTSDRVRSSRRFSWLSASLLPVAAWCLFPLEQLHGQGSPTVDPVIVVTGTGEVRLTPDRAAVTLSVETRRPTASAAGSENARVTKGVLDAVRGAGIPAEDLTTSGYSVMPDQVYDNATRTTRIAGYVVRNTVRARIAKLEQIGAVLDAALSKGANGAYDLEFSSSSEGEARREAVRRAVETARAEAEAIARAAGGTLGQMLEATTAEPQGPVVPMFARARMAADAEAGTPIVAGSQTVSARVVVRWRFIASGGR